MIKRLQRKQKIKRMMYSIPVLIVLIVFTIVFAKGALRVMQNKIDSSRLAKDLEEKAEALTLREEELREEIDRLETKRGVEEEIREKFNVIQGGEHVVVIVEDSGVSSSTDDMSLLWYQRLWTAIMGGK